MRKPKPDKTTPLDEFAVESRPAPEPMDDEVTMSKLDALKAPDLDESGPPAEVIAKIPENRRAEASAALKARWRRMRAYVSGQSEEVDL